MKGISFCSIFMISLNLFATWEIFEGSADEIEFQDPCSPMKTANGDVYNVLLEGINFDLIYPSGRKVIYYHPTQSGPCFTGVALSPVDSTLIACTRDNLIHFYEPNNNGRFEFKKSVLIDAPLSLWGVRFSKDGVYIKAIGYNGSSKILVNPENLLKKRQSRMKGPSKNL